MPARFERRSARLAASLGEMDPEACRRFVAEICRSSRAFFHRNAESSRVPLDGGLSSLVNAECPVPEDEFELVVATATSAA